MARKKGGGFLGALLSGRVSSLNQYNRKKSAAFRNRAKHKATRRKIKIGPFRF